MAMGSPSIGQQWTVGSMSWIRAPVAVLLWALGLPPGHHPGSHTAHLTYLYLELLCRKYLLYRRHDNLARMSLEYEMTHGLFKRKSKIPFYVELNSNGFYSTLETYKKGHNLVVISL